MLHSAILLLGPTGTGKTPLGEYLQERGGKGRTFRHFDFGEQLRSVVRDSGAAAGLSAGEVMFLRQVLEEGVLLEDRHFPIARRILQGFIRQSGMPGAWVVLNGLPRHEGQARGVGELVKVELIVELLCGEEHVLRRLRTNAGGDRTERTDDDPELVKKKLALYQARTRPLVEYYRRLGVEIRGVEVGPETGPAEICRLLDL